MQLARHVIIVILAFGSGVLAAADGQTTPPALPELLAQTLESTRVEYLRVHGALVWERNASLSEFFPEPARAPQGAWTRLRYTGPTGFPPANIAEVPTDGLELMSLPFPEPLHSELTRNMRDEVSAIALNYPHYGIMYLADPMDIQDTALHEVHVMEACNGTLSRDVASRIEGKIKRQSPLALMHAALTLSVDNARRNPEDVATAAYELALTRGLARPFASTLVREISRDGRVVFCFSGKDLKSFTGIDVLVYDAERPLYEMLITRRLGDTGKQPLGDHDAEQVTHIVRSMMQYGLQPDR